MIPSLVKVHNPAGIVNLLRIKYPGNFDYYLDDRCDHGHAWKSKDAEDNHPALSEL